MKLQPKSSLGKVNNVTTPVRTAPAVYQPCPAREVVQARMAVAHVRPGNGKGTPPPVYRPMPTAIAQPKPGPVGSVYPGVPLSAQFGPVVQPMQAGATLLTTVTSPPSTSGQQRWAKGILLYKGENDEREEVTKQEEFGAHSGTYDGDKESCKNKDGYRNRRASGGTQINHSCGEAHVLNWADGILTGKKLRQPSRLIMLTQETMCHQCEEDLVAFSTDHPNTYVQVRSKSLYEARLTSMNSDTTLFRQKGERRNTYETYYPMVGGQYKTKLRDRQALRHLKLNP